MAADGDCHHLCKLMAPVRHRWSINDVIGGIRYTVMPSDCSPMRFGIRSSGRQHSLKCAKGKRCRSVCTVVQQEEVESIPASSYECTIVYCVFRVETKYGYITINRNLKLDVIRFADDLVLLATSEDDLQWITNQGLKQGCPLSRCLFNIYINALIKDWEIDLATHFMIDNKPLKTLLYADDVIILANTEDNLQMNRSLQKGDKS
ncbi:hypothetical protein ANN_10452 [Periplaneta americana]|uniref:Reverse transcriptase domain-containing protein n=1 Tax=Periplaneta americana TaxID=6978 RepID=A0ABQ8TP10_PERAM|nr:hypothetical protein ANN_10452 [Periplaneta americana]